MTVLNPEIYFIVLLLPIAAALVVFQANPYRTLVLRGILGAIAALTYTVLGAADVALTEALVGTLLAITLYAVAVRSSLVLKLGVLSETAPSPEQLVPLRAALQNHYLRLEIVPYSDREALITALKTKDIHAFYENESDSNKPLQIVVRVRRIYDILTEELNAPDTQLNYQEVAAVKGH